MKNRADSPEHKSERTAVLSILKEPDAGTGHDKKGYTQYTILLSFVGSVLLPPYLPRMNSSAGASARRQIEERLSNLVKKYDASYFNHELDTAEAERIIEDLEIVGDNIYKYVGGFKRAMEIINDKNMDVKNLIIHTDEPSIPWSLAFCGPEIWKPEEPHFDFICNRFSCGTILVDTREEAFRWLRNYTMPGAQPDEERLQDRNICLIAASLEDDPSDSESDLGEAYVSRLNDFFTHSAMSNMSVNCITPKDWEYTKGRPGRMIDFLNDQMQKAQIIHFTGHVEHGKMRFDKNTYISPEDLKGLKPLSSKPLVVLHGCSSGQLFDINKEEAQLSQVFLDRGASGCLATILPVNIPRRVGKGAETLVELFYRNVLQLKPYGHALRDARNEFRRRSPSQNDPQALFYQLFGDPRAKLVVDKLTTPDLIEILELDEVGAFAKPSPSEDILTITLEGFSLEDEELLELLRETEGIEEVRKIKKIEKRSSAVSLGLGDPAVGVVVQVVASILVAPVTTVLWERIVASLEARKKKLSKNVSKKNVPMATKIAKPDERVELKAKITERVTFEWKSIKYSRELVQE